MTYTCSVQKLWSGFCRSNRTGSTDPVLCFINVHKYCHKKQFYFNYDVLKFWLHILVCIYVVCILKQPHSHICRTQLSQEINYRKLCALWTTVKFTHQVLAVLCVATIRVVLPLFFTLSLPVCPIPASFC